MRTEAEILKIIEETFFGLYVTIAADNSPLLNLQDIENHKNLLRTKIHCYLDVLCGEDKELYSLKYQELCRSAYEKLSLPTKKNLETRAKKLNYSDPTKTINC